MSNTYLKGVKLLPGWIFSNRGTGAQPRVEATRLASPQVHGSKVGTKSPCIPYAIDHTATVCGVLNESIRFARRDGIDNLEVQRRIAKAEEELNAMERVDMDAEETAKLSATQRHFVTFFTYVVRKYVEGTI
jgi:hypothetical protein